MTGNSALVHGMASLLSSAMFSNPADREQADALMVRYEQEFGPLSPEPSEIATASQQATQ